MNPFLTSNKRVLLQEFGTLTDILISSIGTSGSSVLLQNALKGPITLSGTASTILQRYTTKNPFISLMKAAVDSQRSRHGDGG